MREVLKPGGVLVVSQGMTDRQYRERPRFVPIVDTAALSRIMAIDYFDTSWKVHVLDLIRSGGELEFAVNAFEYVLLLKDDYERLVKEAGFDSVAFYGDLQLAPYDKLVSNQFVMVAQK